MDVRVIAVGAAAVGNAAATDDVEVRAQAENSAGTAAAININGRYVEIALTVRAKRKL